MGRELIRTSQVDWLRRLASAYRERRAVELVDDAEIGVLPGRDSLFDMARLSRLSPRELVAVCISVGMSAAGMAMVVLAFLDPEPTTKLGLLVGGGVACVLCGGLSAVRVLTKSKPPRISVTRRGFELAWD